MRIIFLGTAGTVPTEKRSHPAIVIEYLSEPFLFDCGEGAQRQMRIFGVNPMAINHIFITHFHADHILGIGGLLRSMDFMNRVKPINIHGPTGLGSIIDKLLSIGVYKPEKIKINIFEIEHYDVIDTPLVILEGEKYRVSCIAAEHTNNSLAFCFEEKEKRTFLKERAIELGVPEGRLFSKLQHGQSVNINGKVIRPDDVLSPAVAGRKCVYTGDTKPSDNIVKISENADMLIHDSTYMSDTKDTEDLDDVGHSSAKDAAMVARRAHACALYLTHISQRYTEPGKLEEEARQVFENSHLAEDFMVVEVKKKW